MDNICSYLSKIGLKVEQVEQTEEFESFSLNIWAKPGAKKEKVEVSEHGDLALFFREKPIEGKANKAIIKDLSKKFGIPQGAIELKSGLKSKKKKFSFYFEFTKNKTMSYYIEKFKII